ncbi:hypothetical protein BSPWISOXPB_10756 [uncultured Gammaproteobacteria bacterium]|nr:hypothetical protein BSPWISOXPB_10756 [uncultured Gammaproteobacteria bacterium]
MQEQVCYLDDGSGDFFVDCSTPERKNAFVDKVIKGLEAMYNNKPKDSLPQTQKTDKISLAWIKDTLKNTINLVPQNSRKCPPKVKRYQPQTLKRPQTSK